MTITDIGALVGLAVGILAAVDRLFLGRPITTISPSAENKSFRDLRVENASKQPILLRRIRSCPRWVRVLPDDTSKGAAAMYATFNAVLQPGELRSFPIVIRRSQLVDQDATAWAPFVILVSWRKTRSVWLPQWPPIIFSSARSLRLFAKSK